MKKNILDDILQPVKKAALAYSGGVDSTYLLYELIQRGTDVLALTLLTPDFTKKKQQGIESFLKSYDIKHLYLPMDKLWQQQAFLQNSPSRCYECKRFMFQKLKAKALELGYDLVLDGTNADDVSDFRPGRRALRELGIRSPLKEAGLTKADIRSELQEAGLEVAKLPSEPCIATRVAYGIPLERRKLMSLVSLEERIKDLGFETVRLRDHGTIARLEIPREELQGFVSLDLTDLIKDIKRAGFHYITLDIEGFRSGSMNEMISEEEKRQWND